MLEKFRQAQAMINASMEVVLQVHIQDRVLIHINLTEKTRPQVMGMTNLKEATR